MQLQSTSHNFKQLRHCKQNRVITFCPVFCKDWIKRGIKSLATKTVQTVSWDDVTDRFCKNFSGEWEGVTASFTSNGEAKPLPEYYVPQAFRDWDVELHDWQSLCSSNATTTKFTYSAKRLMPTVGCEADAIAFVEDCEEIWADEGLKPLMPNGSYFWSPKELKEPKSRLEICLMNSLQLRVRLILNIQYNLDSNTCSLLNVDLFNERYYGPYTGETVLNGCGGGMLGFAKTAVTTPEQLSGSWDLLEGLRYNADDTGTIVSVAHATERPVLDPLTVTFLPLGVWYGIECKPESKKLELIAGMVSQSGDLGTRMRSSAQASFNSGKLHSIRLVREVAK